MASRLSACSSILEVGAGERLFLSQIKGFSGTYHTMDVDREQKQTYYTLDDVDGSYDGVVMREVAEHLTPEQFFACVRKVYEVLSAGGVFVLSTPNPWSTWMWCDYTHITPWPPRDMYAVLRAHGFVRVEIARVVWPSRIPLWLKRVYWKIHSSFYPIDPAGSYVAIGYKGQKQA